MYTPNSFIYQFLIKIDKKYVSHKIFHYGNYIQFDHWLNLHMFKYNLLCYDHRQSIEI